MVQVTKILIVEVTTYYVWHSLPYSSRLGTVGGVVGAKIGLTDDTSLALVPSNVEVKDIGIGLKVGLTGFEMCFFGSCVWVG